MLSGTEAPTGWFDHSCEQHKKHIMKDIGNLLTSFLFQRWGDSSKCHVQIFGFAGIAKLELFPDPSAHYWDATSVASCALLLAYKGFSIGVFPGKMAPNLEMIMVLIFSSDSQKETQINVLHKMLNDSFKNPIGRKLDVDWRYPPSISWSVHRSRFVIKIFTILFFKCLIAGYKGVKLMRNKHISFITAIFPKAIFSWCLSKVAMNVTSLCFEAAIFDGAEQLQPNSVQRRDTGRL